MPLISVIIPAYNEEKDIPICIWSLSEQSFRDFELIIVDDGSTDKTIATAMNVAKIAKIKLVVLKQNHGGPGKARNIGAKKAKGKILVFVDADMSFEKIYLENLISPIKNDEKGEIIGTTHDYEIATNTKNVYSSLWGKIRQDFRGKEKEWTKYIRGGSPFRAIKKKDFIKLGGFDPIYGYVDDQTFWLKYRLLPTLASDTTCFHRNPESLKGTYNQARWIGASWKERFPAFKIPILNTFVVASLFFIIPIAALYKSLQSWFKGHKLKYAIPFYFYKFSGYSIGVLRAVYFNKNFK